MVNRPLFFCSHTTIINQNFNIQKKKKKKKKIRDHTKYTFLVKSTGVMNNPTKERLAAMTSYGA